ncbi:non-ribosomal peptide synthetase [Lactococcus sp. NH2-7C]|uniref:non-ribosomal peptide synthetase n=1 Tax=Lactococcus sp. NH2-7C TaxID=2879149 RepID=UPI002106AB14|nr:non-ribosomal peptide synthetase [Lactococcus sp. NH2-7C]WGV29730.1 amino acid adenylation domain-containing protein [Lactococcus sp. NH2-7C]
MKTIIDAFEKQVRETPERVAVTFGSQSLTYQELNKQSNALAHYLSNTCGVKQGDIIPLLLERNEKMIIAILAVLKLGACYTAISKEYPSSRIEYIKEQTSAKVTITDELLNQKFNHHTKNPEVKISLDDLAYIVYTSGTTGNPKGVIHTHRSVMSHITAYCNFVKLNDSQEYNMLFLVNYIFSVAVTQIFSALLYGHNLVISENGCLENIEKFTKYINDNEINYFQCTPSLAEEIDYSRVQSVHTIAVSGEVLSEKLFKKAQDNGLTLYNIYGQSELHSGTGKLVSRAEDIRNIGSALGSVGVHVLNENLQEVKIGDIGEICFTGSQLSLGYLKLDRETKGHFVKSPFGNGMLCKTGDLVKRLPNNEFEFIGRNDFQLNINGIRTEPMEIESQLLKVPEIHKTVVVGFENQFIAAYYVSDKELDESYIRGIVNPKLTDYMQPQVYIWLKELPLNLNGKLDRSKLPDIEITKSNYLPPQTDTEKLLVKAIEQVLGLNKIGVLDNFSYIGGNSLNAMQVANYVYDKVGKQLSAKIIFDNQPIKKLAAVLEQQPEEVENNIRKSPDYLDYLMSPAQRRMFIAFELDREGISYNEQTVTDFTGRIDELQMRNSLTILMANHESLRTKFFRDEKGNYVQKIMPVGHLDFEVIAHTHNYSELVKPFNLEAGHTMRVVVLRGDGRDSLFIDKHHIITDGISEEYFYEELSKLYDGGESVTANSFHYKDFSEWFNQLDRGEEKQWWNQFLNGYQRLEIATDFKKSNTVLPNGENYQLSIDKKIINRVSSFSKTYAVSEYTIFLSALSILLSKMYSSEDFILGTVSNGRTERAAEKILGMFVNTLPLRVKPYSDLTLKQYMLDTKEMVFSAILNQNYQFEEIVNDLGATSDMDNPLFNCMFVYQNMKRNEQLFGGRAHKNSYRSKQAKFDITFEIDKVNSDDVLIINYDKNLFLDDTIHSLAKRFFKVLEKILDDTDSTIGEVTLVEKEEIAALTQFEYPQKYIDVISLFEKQVETRPDFPALSDGETSYTYRQLNQEVNSLSNLLLKTYDVKAEQKIPLLLKRSCRMVIAILAVLKAGAAYVPISLKYPKDRIEYIIDTCENDFVIDEDFMTQSFSQNTANPNVTRKSNQLAYIIFTSGTTGKPKGVMVEHGNLSNFCIEVPKMNKSGIHSEMVNGAFFEYVFDSSIHDLVRPFTMGESVVILDTDLIYDIEKFINTLIDYKINAIGMTPSLAARVDLSKVPTMKVLHCGGESITEEVISKYHNSGIQINNCYGPTENTVLSFVNNDVSDLSIGVPLTGVEAYVVDNKGNLLPQGGVGTLFVGGRQVTRGYINQPDETSKRYLDSPFSAGKVYDTGDLVRKQANGKYQFWGRKDSQVKVRGFRVELGEIESAMKSVEGIEQVAVIVKDSNLIGYYVAEHNIREDNLYSQLARHLPEYMIPSFFVKISSIPLTINGKLDVKSLPSPEYEENYIAPTNEREKQIEQAFCEVLHLPKVSTSANFFRLGGNSILAISLAKLINVSVKTIFEQKTIFNIAKVNEKIVRISKQEFSSEQEQVLSFAQERIWVIENLEQGTVAYNIPLLLTLNDEVDVSKLEKVVHEVIERHEVLRTVIKDNYQRILPPESLVIGHELVNKAEFFSRKFDLENEIPIRVNVFGNQLYICIHHIAFDGWSTNIFLKEIIDLYNGESLNRMEFQYKDYSKWQREFQTPEEMLSQREYWKEKLMGYEGLDFPTDFSRPAQFDYKGDELNYKLEGELLNSIKDLAKKNDASYFGILYSAFVLLISAYSNKKDIAVGSPIANRHIQGTGELVGLFVNTVVLRSKINIKGKFDDLVAESMALISEVQKNQDYPFEKVVEVVEKEKDLSKNPIFQVMFNIEELDEKVDNNNIFTSINDQLSLHDAKFDITVTHRKNVVNFNYATSLFSRDTIQGIAETYERLLKQIVKNSEIQLEDIIYNADEEKGERKEFPTDTLQTLFEKQVELHPNDIAIVFQNRKLTYRELNEKANQFANTLLEDYQITKGSHVPILMSRSEKYVIAILGILKVGANYVPMSLEYPEERVQYIVKKVNSPLLVTDDFSVKSLNPNNPNIDVGLEELAYIIFTSGTTGVPKGVMVEQKSVINTIYNQFEICGDILGKKAVHFSNFVFDVSVSELFYILLSGATMYLLDDQTRKDYQLLKSEIENNDISFGTIPPAVLSPDNLLPLETLIVAGEPTPSNIYKAYSNSGTTIINSYGPTETTIYATQKVYEEGMNPNNIGKSLINNRAYVLNDSLQRVPLNGVGELFVGGLGVARGYFEDNEKTKHSFIDHPTLGRIYRTGDLVKSLPSGEYIYLGRNDSQVKVRGFRIELGEIETKLLKQKTVSQCLAIVRGNNIVVYYKGKLQRTLQGELPQYMLPSSYVELEEFPVTLNGKVDIKALPDPVISNEIFIAPKKPREKEIAAAFCELLSIDKVSILDNFYSLGGNSILALKLARKVDLEVREIFEFQNIRELAKLLPREMKISQIEKRKDGNYPLSFAQERLWFIEQYEDGTSSYNVPIILRLSKETSAKKVENAILEIVSRHEILRTTLKAESQVVHDNLQLQITYEKIDTEKYIGEKFDLETSIPIRVNIFDDVVAIVVHHIAFDGWSTELFLKELIQLYNGKTLKPLPIQYKDYSVWQKRYLSTQRTREQGKFWDEYLQDYETLNLPNDFERPKDFTYKGEEIHTIFQEDLKYKLERIAKKYKTSLYTVMLSALDVMLVQYSYQKDIIIGTPFANRHIKGTENLIGFFVNTLPVRTIIDGNEKFGELVIANHKKILTIQKNQDIPFEQVVNRLQIEQDSSRNAVFQVLFSVQDFSKTIIDDSKLFLSMNQEIDYHSAKYDLSVMVEDGKIGFNYCSDLFEESTMESMMKTYVSILNEVSSGDEKLIRDFSFSGNYLEGETVVYPKKTIVDLFEEQVKRTPNAVAIEYQNISLTYLDFDRLTNRFANELVEKGVRSGEKIPVILERSEKLPIAIWGILKAGCAYVPISPEFPNTRKEYILREISSKIVIDENYDVYKGENEFPVTVFPKLTDLAYIIFTSGTTGNPKGVMINHDGLSNRIQWMNSKYPITCQDSIYQKTNFIFDVSVWEETWALIAGAKIVFAKEGGHKDPLYLAEEIKNKRITVMHFVPSMLDAFMDTITAYGGGSEENSFDFSSLKYIFCSGESLGINSVKLLRSLIPNVKVYNLYGPTEASIDVTYFDCNAPELSKVLIGKPVANTSCYTLGVFEQQIPFGGIGELAIAGVQLSQGYINQKELTAEKFINYPKVGRLYKTGDLVRFCTNQDIEYLGRNDFQVKIRGLRIELGEIEAKLGAVNGIKQVAVIEKAGQLIAYYQARAEFSSEFLQEKLSQSLVDYMIPNVFIFVEKFPLTINGKLDRRALPVPTFSHKVFADAQDNRERTVQKIVADILGQSIKSIDVNESFFHLGGDSIKAIQLSNRIKQQLDSTVTIKQIFEEKTVKKISSCLELKEKVESLREDGELTGESGLLPIQKWFFEEVNSNSFIQAFGISLPKNINLAKLNDALVSIVNYHDALRFRFNGRTQYYAKKVQEVQLINCPTLKELEKLQISFELDKELYRFVFVEKESILAVLCHHLVIDTVSWQIIATDLKDLYGGKKLLPKGTSYRQWVDVLENRRNTK